MFSASCQSLLKETLSSLQRVQTTPIPLTFVRWRKKRDIPRAKSKFFVVREPTYQPPEEREELLFRYKRYNTQMKAIR